MAWLQRKEMPDIDYIDLVLVATPDDIGAVNADKHQDSYAFDTAGRPATQATRLRIMNGKKMLVQ